MGKIEKKVFAGLLLGVALLSGCVRKEAVPAPTPTPEPTAVPTPSPTPVPTPIPYDLVAGESGAVYAYAADYAQVSAALSAARENAAHDAWAERFAESGGAADGPALPEGARLAGRRSGGDILSADGRYLYILTDKDLAILRADGEAEELLSRTRIGVNWTGRESAETQSVSGFEKTPLALYPAGNRLAVVYDWYGYDGSPGSLSYTEYAAVDIFDISDPTAPALSASFGQDGSFCTAGLYDNMLYVLTDCAVFDDWDSAQPESFAPHTYGSGGSILLPADKICTVSAGKYSGYSVIGAYDLAASAQRDVQALLGIAPDAYTVDNRLFFLSSRWAESPSRVLVENGTQITESAVVACTDIYRFAVNGEGLALQAVGTVNGIVPGASALDLRDGVLRCLVSLRQHYFAQERPDDADSRAWDTGTALLTLDDELRPLGKLEYLPQGESIRWAGFLSDSVVLTTTDGTSYLAGLDDPAAPAVSDALPTAIQAEAILPWGGDGYMAFYRTDADKLTLSVRDASLRELASRTFGSDHSNTLESRDCYLSDADANILAFAADDSYCVYGYDAQNGLSLRTDVFLNDWAWNARGFRVGNRLYVADTRELFVFDLEELKLLNSFAW